MVIRFIQSWQHYSRNAEYDIVDGVATTLVRRRIAEAVSPTAPSPAVAAPASAKRKPGRPRKS